MRISELVIKLSRMQAQYGDATVIIPKLVRPKKRKKGDITDDEVMFANVKDVAPITYDNEALEVIISSMAVTEDDKYTVGGEVWDNADDDK